MISYNRWSFLTGIFYLGMMFSRSLHVPVLISEFFLFGCIRSYLQHAGSLLQHMGSLAVACRLSSAACVILVPQPGLEHIFPALQGRFLSTGPPEKYTLYCYIKIFRGTPTHPTGRDNVTFFK